MEPEAVRAYRIADNRTGENAEWDFDLLPIEIGALQDSGFDCELLGFDSDELAKLLDPGVEQGLTDPDEVPEPPDEAVTQPGDVWILGDHRLLCGDSSKAEDVDRLLAGAKIHMVNTDPPYNVNVEPRSKNAIAAGNSSFPAGEGKTKAGEKKMRAKDRVLANDKVSDDDFEKLLAAWFGNIGRVLEPGRCFYIWGGFSNIGCYPPALAASGLYLSQTIIWDKMHPVINRKDFMSGHEWAFYGWREGAGHKFFGPNNATDLWHVKKIPPQQLEHLTGKPAELAVTAMQYSSRKGENVLDLFGGSGSTLIAAEQTGRKGVLDGTRSTVLRRDRRPLPTLHRQAGDPRTNRRITDSGMVPREEKHAVMARVPCRTKLRRQRHRRTEHRSSWQSPSANRASAEWLPRGRRRKRSASPISASKQRMSPPSTRVSASSVVR